MLSIGAMGHGAGHYYIGLAREDYYQQGGEPPGMWLGRGAADLGLTGPVHPEAFHPLLSGFGPDGRPLLQNAGKPSHQPGWDLTFSAPKSVSVLWSQGDLPLRQAIQAAHFAAVQAALSYLEAAASFTRRGKGGVAWEEAKLMVAAFEHGTSRAQDPQLHTHALVLNAATRSDGTTGTLLSKPLYQHKMTAGALYRAELAWQLEERLGLDIQRRQNLFEVKGVPPSLLETFSTRRQEIAAALTRKGLASAQAAAVTALETRQAKAHVARDILFAAWQAEGVRHGFTERDARRLIRDVPPDRGPDPQPGRQVETAIQQITHHESHFAERELLRRTAEAAPGTHTRPAELRAAVRDTLQQNPEIVSLGRWRMEERYTTQEMLALEEQLLSTADQLQQQAGPKISAGTVEGVIATREQQLNGEQAQALRHLTTETGRIAVVSGLAGTGKTSLLRAARLVWELEGYQVQGAALSGKAAQGLEVGAGIASATLHRTLQEIERGERAISPKTVLVLDEAGMVGTRQMERLLSAVEQGGGKLVLVGDERQLQPIEAGGPFQALGERIGRAELKEIVRQREAWARASVKQLSEGHAQAALRAYAERGLVQVAEDRQGAMEALIQAWQGEGVERPQNSLIFCGTRAEAATLNRMAQAAREETGILGERTMRIRGETIHEGDRVLFTRNSRLYNVKNGSLGTVERIASQEAALRVKLDTGERTTIPLAYYDHLKLGYAVTTHKGQGVTVAKAYVLVGGPMQDRELTYVQASRAREETRLYVEEAEAGPELTDLTRKMGVSHPKHLAASMREHDERVHKMSR